MVDAATTTDGTRKVSTVIGSRIRYETIDLSDNFFPLLVLNIGLESSPEGVASPNTCHQGRK